VLESDHVKSFWKTAAFVSCVILICAAAITWQFVRARAIQRKLAEDAGLTRERAEQGDASAQFKLARMFYLGKGEPQDYTEAVRWYRKAADQGYAKAQFNLSDMYRDGKGVPQDYAEAVRWCRKAAEQGDTKAQDGLAFMFYQGQGLPQDYAEAVRWYRRAADQGDAMAQDGLGFMYYQGKGVSKDYAEALRWYQKAADQGYAKAQYALGYMYYYGQGVPQDDSEAAAWYRRAAEQGYTQAQPVLGYMYFQGRGVQRSYAEAARWYRKASKQGDEYSRRALAAMKIEFDTPTKVLLSLGFLGSILLLILSRGDIRNRQQRRVAIGGLLGVLRVGLDVYGHSHFGILQALSAVNVFYFGKSLLSGILGAVLLPVVWPQGFKIVLTICATLFIGFNIYAMAHYDLRHITACPRAFYSTNGLLIGIAITSALHLWLAEKSSGSGNGNARVAPGTVAGTE
jgi:TPR repeat protein